MNETGNHTGSVTNSLPNDHPVPAKPIDPLLTTRAVQAADEAACRLDGMFRDLFNREDRYDLIVTILRAASKSASGGDFWEPAND